ncbi:MAG: GGDEF domain-containing response regulator [Myxococcales bacterium]|nr:GGDEF domain-containing response regulator [Myxococcales bacterium]
MPLHVLLVEDDPFDAELAELELRRERAERYEVRHVPGLEAALAALADARFDVVLLDLGLPDACGFEGVTRVIANAPEAAIIVLTGQDDDAVGAQAVALGAQDFLVKGVGELHRLSRAIELGIERKRRMEAVRHAGLHDPLTGLPNRALFDDRLAAAANRAARYGEGVAVAFVDLDGFKAVNDRFGHATGDEVLKAAARGMSEAVRAIDTVARLGGDEFACIYPGVADPQGARVVGKRLVLAGAEAVAALDLLGGELEVTLSVGMALYPQHTKSLGELVRLADEAMYAAKRAGGARVVVARRAPLRVPTAIEERSKAG